MDSRTDQAFQLFQQHWKTVGVLVRDHLDEYDLYTVEYDGTVVGAALADHGFDTHTLVHALAVDAGAQGQGIARSLVTQIAQDSPHDQLHGKCRKGLDSNDFYRATGWTKQRETGDGRMNVWTYEC